ncbi:MAG: hypothetical protein ACRCYU_18720 [Nocardioides sp.]
MLFNSPEVQVLRLYMAVLLGDLKSRQRDERGDIATTVIIIAILAAGAIAIGAIIVQKFTNKASTIPTE